MEDFKLGDAERTYKYPLGHSDRELQRLIAQARLIEPITRKFFRAAGIGPGMRILDVGSGAGDTAFLAADLVGATGEVIGVDKAPAAIAVARARVQAHSIRNVSFCEGDPAELIFDQPFDAIVGRYVLQFCASPTAMLRRLAAHLRPGGVIVFHELDWDGVRSYPQAPIYDRCCRWFVETLQLLGTETRMGIKLHSAFTNAGLRPPSMRVDAIIGAGSDVSEWLQALADLVRIMLPELERLGIATAAEVDIDTLADRLRRENAAHSSVVVGRAEVCAWSRV